MEDPTRAARNRERQQRLQRRFKSMLRAMKKEEERLSKILHEKPLSSKASSETQVKRHWFVQWIRNLIGL